MQDLLVCKGFRFHPVHGVERMDLLQRLLDKIDGFELLIAELKKFK